MGIGAFLAGATIFGIALYILIMLFFALFAIVSVVYYLFRKEKKIDNKSNSKFTLDQGKEI